MRHVKRFTIVSALMLSLMQCCAAGDFVWVECEAPAKADFKWKTAGAEKKDVLSADSWLMIETRGRAPEDGWNLSYEADVPRGGTYGLWLRIGFEWIRPGVLWRIDAGKWTGLGVPPVGRKTDKPAGKWQFDAYRRTTNVKELGFWAEVAWLELGNATLKAGKHTIDLKFVEGRGDNPLLAVDAICLVQGKWTPEGRLKPGETYDDEIDRRAAAQVYALPEPAADTTRVSVELTGPWQIARYDDPDMDVDTYQPVKALPEPDEHQLAWMGLEVPKARLWSHKELAFAHRVVYRSKVRVPAAHKGRGFKLHFAGTHWIASVFVNGKYAGAHRGVWIAWDLDVSQHVKPGEVNEIAVAVKGHYYALDCAHMGKGDLEDSRNRPLKNRKWTRWVAPIYPSSKGDGDGYQHGIVSPVSLVSVGRAYVDDVFIKPSVAEKRLDVDVTVRNMTGLDGKFQVVCEAVYDPDKDRKPEKTFAPVAVSVPADETAQVTVSGPWADPKLWWPEPNPHLYRLRTRVLQDGRPIDVQEELFGFREVTVKGTGVYINGVRRNVWNWVDVAGSVASPADWARKWREEGNRFMRFSYGRKIQKFFRSREERLEFYDRHGIAGRLCSMIDGMFISYHLGDRLKDGVLVPNEFMWQNFCEHIAQLAKAYRNHPSVIMYQIENELIYVNGNHYWSYMDSVEAETMKMYLAGYANDPTRPYTIGGGGDLRFAKGFEGRRIEINCPHYPRGAEDWYPDDAYKLTQYATKIQRWPWDRTNPWIVGESLYASEIQLGSYAAGPLAYRSQQHVERAKARFVRAMYDGYRWAGVAGFFPWCNLSMYEDGRKMFSDLVAIPRKRSLRLYGGRENRLHFKVMNDTLKREPVAFEWRYEAEGKTVAEGREALDIEPGFGREQWLAIAPPSVDARLDGVLHLRVAQPGSKEFVDSLTVPTLPVVRSVKVGVPVAVYDKSGKLGKFLSQAGVDFSAIEGLAALKERNGMLLVGPDTLSPKEAFGSDLLKFAVRGNQVIVLEQEVPVSGANVSAPLRSTTRFGGYAHPQALGTPLFRDLGRDDLIDWAGEHPTYKNVYVKPSQGARSLVECGPNLPYSALLEMGAGNGVMVLCQLRVGAKLGIDPAADVLLRNMIEVYAGRKPSKAVAGVYAPGNSLLLDKLAGTGALHKNVTELSAALDPAKYRSLIVDATAENLAALNRHKAKAEAYQQAGGWIMLCGVNPQSVDAFNEFMGTKHLLRPFRVERVFMQNQEHPLAATLADSNVSYYSPSVIASWRGMYWVSGNTFSHVIDGMDAAPFTLPPGASDDPYEYKPTKDDHDPYNFVNGMLSSDFWRYIQQIWVVKAGENDPNGNPGPVGLDHTFRLRQPETIKQINIWSNAAYSTIEKLDIIFDGDAAHPLAVVLPNAAALKEVPLAEPREVKKTVTLRIKSWRVNPAHPHPLAKHLVGIDNVQFIRVAAPSHGIPLDNVGGLVVFPRGKGGVFLNQVKFMEDEPNKVNAPKKVALTSVILQNMGVGSTTSTVPVPGYNIRYETLDITDYCNTYLARQERKPGWFGRGDQDLRTLQKGKRHLAEVMYHVVDYGTAPVPDCITLGWRSTEKTIKGVAVGGKKADVILFLQSADVHQPITDGERARMNLKRRAFKLPVVATYTVRYADGKTADIPVVLERHVDHWLQADPKPLADATVAWSAAIEGVEGRRGTLYTMKAANPRPGVPIENIDINFGQRHGDTFKSTRRVVLGVVAIILGTIMEGK